MPEPTSEVTVQCSALLVAVELCRNKWGERASYLEDLAGYDKDVISMRHREHAKIIRNCISELYREVEAANAKVSEGGTRDSRIETAAQSRPSLH